jgi:hypothetical protein
MKARASYTGLLLPAALLLTVLGTSPLQAQEMTTKKRTQEQIDSMVAVAEGRLFPFFGAKVAAKGVDLPFPIGINLHSYVQDQQQVFTDLKFGFNGGELVDGDFVVFDDAVTRTWVPQLRVDTWILPFFNLYGLVGPAFVDTEVELAEPIPLVVRTDGTGLTYGIGGSLSGGHSHYWGSASYSWSWTDVDSLEEPAHARVFGLRVGTNLHLGRVRKVLSIWVGASHQYLESATRGSATVVNLLPIEDGTIEEALQGYDETEWYQDLPRPTQKIVDDIVEAILELPYDTWTIEYDVQKYPLKPWNMVMGAQMDLSRRWNLTTELGLLGARRSLQVQLSYRFAAQNNR